MANEAFNKPTLQLSTANRETRIVLAKPTDNSDNKLIQYNKQFKVIVVGDSNVGKTTLTYRFCEGGFLNDAEATIGVDFRSRKLNIEGEEIVLQLWDTAGQERFRNTMVRHYYRNANAIIFVYDVTNAASFDSLKKWVMECYQNCPQDILRILVGNKCDGVPSVTTNVAARFADQNNMPLFETSAKLDSQSDMVEAIFMTLAYKLKNHKPFMTSRKILYHPQEVSHMRSPPSKGCCG